MDLQRGAAADIDQRVQLDVVGAIEGADKSSAADNFSWDYLKHYETLFAPYRARPINLLEVGVQGGPSMRLWKWYFTRANIVGIDIDPACADLAEERVSIRIGSQADGPFLQSICDETPPTIFIDDGSHLAEHVIFTFEQVFPRLLAGGIYIIEDMAFHLGEAGTRWQGGQKRSAVAYFLDLARSRMARQPIAGQEHVPPKLHFAIDSIMFIDSAVVIRKKYAGRDAAAGIKAGQSYIKSGKPRTRTPQNLAAYILRHNGDLNVAESICRQTLKRCPKHQPTLLLLAETLIRQERHQEAATLLHQPAPPDPATGGAAALLALNTLARLQSDAGLTEDANQTLDCILARAPRNQAALALRNKLAGAASG